MEKLPVLLSSSGSKMKNRKATSLTVIIWLQRGAGPGPGGRAAGVERVVGGSGGRVGAAGARALRISAGGVQQLSILSCISRRLEGQLLLLQELDLFQLLLELLVLEPPLLMHTLEREANLPFEWQPCVVRVIHNVEV